MFESRLRHQSHRPIPEYEPSPFVGELEVDLDGYELVEGYIFNLPPSDAHWDCLLDEDYPFPELFDSSNVNTFLTRKQAGPLTPLAVMSKRYNPMTVPLMHRRFADTSLSENDVLKFANQYGLACGFPELFMQPELATELETRYSQVKTLEEAQAIHLEAFLGCQQGVPVKGPDGWQESARFVYALIELYDSLSRKRDDRDLKIMLEDNPAFSRLGGTFQHLLRSGSGTTEHEFQRERPQFNRSLREKVTEYICEHVNSRLSNVVPRIGDRRGSITLRPSGLTGAIWAHFALEIAGQVQIPQACPICGKWFHPQHGSEKYCGNGCKQRAYRLNKKRKEVQSNG